MPGCGCAGVVCSFSAPVSQPSWLLRGRKSNYLSVQILQATSEKAFSKLKAMLRKAEERTVSSLWDLIGKLVGIFQPTECANYFSSCGYDPE